MIPCPRCQGDPFAFDDGCPRCADRGEVELDADYDVEQLDVRVAGDELERAVGRVLARRHVAGAEHEAGVLARGLVRLAPAARLEAAARHLRSEELAQEVVQAFARAS